MSKGIIPRAIASCHLACRECRYFNDSDDEIYYCELSQADFPGLCEHYFGKSNVPDERLNWLAETAT